MKRGNKNRGIGLYSYRMLTKNVRIIFALLYASVVGLDLWLLSLSPNFVAGIVDIFLCSLLFLSYYILLKSEQRQKERRDIILLCQWISSFTLLLIGTSPIIIHLLLSGNWDMVENFGFATLISISTVNSLMLPLCIIIFVSMIYWMLVLNLYNESYLYFKCLKSKKQYGI